MLLSSLFFYINKCSHTSLLFIFSLYINYKNRKSNLIPIRKSFRNYQKWNIWNQFPHNLRPIKNIKNKSYSKTPILTKRPIKGILNITKNMAGYPHKAVKLYKKILQILLSIIICKSPIALKTKLKRTFQSVTFSS
jgi:hypothetical protein